MALVHYTKEEDEEKKKKERGKRAQEGWAAKQQSIAKNREEMLQREKRLNSPFSRNYHAAWGAPSAETRQAAIDFDTYARRMSLADEMYKSGQKYRDSELMQRAGALGYNTWQDAQKTMGGNIDEYVKRLGQSDRDREIKLLEQDAEDTFTLFLQKDRGDDESIDDYVKRKEKERKERWSAAGPHYGSLEYYENKLDELQQFQQYAEMFGSDEQKARISSALSETKTKYAERIKEENPAAYMANEKSEYELYIDRSKIYSRMTELGGTLTAKGEWIWDQNAAQGDNPYDEEELTKKYEEFLELKDQYDIVDAAYNMANQMVDQRKLQRLEDRSKSGDADKGREMYKRQEDLSFDKGNAIDSVLGAGATLTQKAERLFKGQDIGWMNSEEEETYFRLLSMSIDDANEYKRIVQTAGQAEQMDYWRRFAGGGDAAAGNDAQGWLAWGLSIPLNLLSGVAPHTEAGQWLNTTAMGMRQGNAERLNEKYGTIDENDVLFAGKGWGDVSQLGASVIESWILGQIAGGVGGAMEAAGASAEKIGKVVDAIKLGGTALLGGSAAAADYRECRMRGMDDTQALTHSVLAGINEAAFEYISLDKLVKVGSAAEIAAKELPARKFFKEMFVAWAAQSGIEASEEFCTTLANRAADALQAEFTHNYSQYRQAVLDKIADGMSPEEARKVVDKQYATDIMCDAIGGAISGGLGAAGQYLGPTISVAANEIRNVSDIVRFGELGFIPSEYRDAAWEHAALDRTGAGKTLTVETPTANLTQRVQMQTDGVSAIESYAKDNGITVKGTDTELTQSGQRRQNRAFTKTVEQTVSSIETQMEKAGSIEKAAQVHAELVSKYGDGIRTVADEALTRASYTISSRDSGSVSAAIGEGGVFQQARAISDEKAAEAATKGVNAAVEVKGTYTEDQAEKRAADTHLFRERLRTSNSNVDLNVSLTSEDGSERTGEIRGWSNDGRNLVLTDGSVVSPESIHGNADTMNAVQYLKQAGLGAATNVVWQKYLTSGALSTEDAATWIGNYVAAVNDGKAGVLTLKQSQERSKLDAETAKEAYELGEKLAEEEISRKETEIAEKRKNTKEGATGRKGSVTLAKGLTNKRLREVRNSKNMAGFGLQLRAVRNIAEALGIDVVLHDSSIEGDKYTGWSGKYEDGKIHLDINGNRSFINDMGAGILAVTGHELTHWLQEYAPRQYAAYKVAVLQALSNEKGIGWLDRSIAAKQENHLKKHGEQMSSHEAEDEIVSDASEKRMGDEEFWAAIGDQLGEDKQGVKAAISKWIKKWLGKLREGIGMTPSLPAATRAMDQVASDIDKSLAAMYAGLVKTATENYRAVQAEVEVQNSDRSAETYTDREAEKEHYGAESAADGVRFSLRTEQPPTKTQIVYKLMRLGKDGNLYPLFIDSASGIEVGKWYDADSPDFRFLQKMPEGVFLVDTDTQTYTTLEDYQKEHGDTRKRKLPTREWVDEATRTGKRWMTIEPSEKSVSRYGGETRRYYNVGINGSGSVSTFALRPGWHAGSLPTMRQIGKGANKNLRDDTFVWVQGRVPADIDYQAEAERNVDKDIPTKIPKNGYYLKATNANATASQADRVGWYVAGSFIADRIMGDAETREVIDRWNAAHPNDEPVEYDYDRESGKVFNAETMQLEERKYSDRDTEYLELAKDPEKNRERLQEMVDEAARKAGYNSPKLYHGTNRFGFTVVDSKKANDRISFFATDSPETAGTYSGTTEARRIADANGSSNGMYQIYANTDGFMELDAGGAESNHIALGGTESDYNYQMGTKGWRTHVTAKQAASYAKSKGLPGVVIHNVIDTATPESRQTAAPANVYVFFNPQQQVKSADPVTYDDDGNVIPLSERFNSENEDIRYSDRDQDANDGEIHTITNEQGRDTGIQDGRGTALFSERTYDEGGKEALEKYLKARMRDKDPNKRITKAEMDQVMDSVKEVYDALQEIKVDFDIYKEWAEAEVEKTFNGLPVFSWAKNNTEYGKSMDASLICIKRRTLDAVFDHMIKNGMMDDFDMVQQSIVAINDIIRSHDFEIACGLCYIDAKRYRAAIVADQFVQQYNRLVRSMVPKDSSFSVDYFNYGQNKLVKNSGEGIDTFEKNDKRLSFKEINRVLKENAPGENSSGNVEYKIARALKEDPKMRRLLLGGDFMSHTGFTEVERSNERLMGLYNAKKGTGGPKATENDTQYLHEVLGRGFTAKKYFDVGGLRVQSFSDYIPRLVFDYVEMVADMAAKKIPSHAYTKELMFALQFGMTGMKINMSLIPLYVKDGVAPGLDANGNYAWRDGQSFGSTVYGINKAQADFLANILGEKVTDRLTAEQGFKLAKLIQNAKGYSNNCGTIAIGVSNEQIFKMLEDDDIRMVIPYHKSGLNHILASLMGVNGFADYTDQQNTLKKKDGKWVKLEKGDKDFNFNKYMVDHKCDAKTAADAYIAWCEKKGYAPKFSGSKAGTAVTVYDETADFTKSDGYYKVLEDFNSYDAVTGEAAPQQAVKTVFPGADSAFGDMKSLMRMAIEGESLLQARQDADVPNIVAEIRKTLPILEAKLREAAGITDEERSGMTTAQIAEREKSAKAEDIKDAYEAWRTENGYRESMREDTEYSDLELMENAAQALTEAGGEDYWNALLASVPELEGKQGAVQTQIEGVRDQARKARQTEEKLLLLQRQVEDYAGDDPARLTKRRFTEDVLRTFSIPGAQQADFTDLLNKVVDHVISGNSFSELDARPIFDSLLMAGRVREQDEYYSNIRNDLRGKTIYVNETVRQEIGDDWNEWKRRAKNAGITITTTENRDVKTENGTKRQRNPGIDEVYMEMSEQYPGAFSENETSGREQLYNMIETSESGRLSTKTLDESVSEAQAQDMYASFLRQISDLQQRAELEIAARSSNALAVAKARQEAKAAKDAMKEAVEKANDRKNAWKKKAEHNADLIASVLESKRRDIRDLRTQINRQNEDLRKLKAAADKTRQDAKDAREELQKRLNEKTKEIKALEKEAKKARDVLAGKMLTPELKKLLAWERAQAAHQTETRKQEQFDRYKERKAATELRGKIRNLTDEIRRTATKPTERNFLPAHLADAMVELLDMLEAYGIDTPKPGTKAAEKYYSAADGIRKLSDAYLEMKNDPDYTWSSEFDQDVYDGLVKLAKQFQKTTKDGYSYTATMSDLTLAEMQQVYDTIKEIRDGMRNAARMIGLEGSRSVYDYGNSIIQNQRELQKLKNDKSKLGRKISRLMGTVQLDALSAMRAAHMIGGGGDSAIYQLWKHIEDGLGTKNRVIMESNKMLQDLKTGKNELTYLKAMRDKVDYGIKDVNGKTVMLTPMQALQIYMTWQREVANDRLVHMQEGGIIVRDSELLAKGKFEEAETTKQNVKVTPETIRKIENKLTSWDRAYMQASRNVFDSLLKQSNKVLYELKHKVHQGEKNYIPEKVSSDYLQQEVVKGGEFNLGIKEAGATKDLVQRSTLPIVIDGLETLLNHHINEMANYIGLAMPIRNFAKVYNMRTQGIGVDAATVNGEISNTWGGKAGQMMLDTLRELQNGKTYEYKTVMHKAAQALQSAFVKASLVGKISVALKQMASYAAAGSVLSQKALDTSQQWILPIIMMPNSKFAKRIYARIDARTAENYIRRQGLSMEEIAMDKLRRGPLKDKIQQAGAWMEKSTVGKYARRGLSWLNPTNWIQRVDVATTTALVVACEKQAKYDGFKKGTQAYEDHVTELYERVIRETQPMYDALHRPELQKNAHWLAKATMPFRTVPFQNYGQIMDSFMMYANAERTGTKAEKVAAAKHVGKTLWANIESALIFAALGMVAAFSRHKINRYLDDDDELTLESVLKAYGLDVLDVSLGNLMPYGGTELKDIVERMVNGDKWYDPFSVGSVELASDMVRSITNVLDKSQKQSNGEATQEDVQKAVIKMVLTSTKFFGIPAENVTDIVTGVKADITDLSKGKWSIDRTGATNARRFIKALEAGDWKKAEAVMEEMRENILKDKPGLKEDKVNSRIQGYVTSYIKEQYEAGNMSEAKATKYLVEHGTAEDENDAYWKIREWDARAAWTGPSEEFSFSKFTEMREILSEGGDISDEVERLTSHGVTFETVNKEIGEAIQELYEDGKLSKEEATQMLVKYHKTKDDGEYRPDTKNEAYWKADEWEAKQEYGDDYNDSNYRDLYAAIDGNKDPAAAVKELKDHGYSEDKIKSAAKSRLIENYVAGGVTESALRNQLSRYCGIVVKDDVEKIVNDANCRKQYGVSYSSIDDEYRAGNITKTETRSALMKYGGLSGEEADKKIRWYDLQKANPNLTVTESGCNTWYDGTAKTRENGHESAKAAGMSIENYLKAKETLSGISDANGNGTGEDEYIAALSKMTGLTSRQKDALYYEKYKGTTKYSRKTW